MEKIDKQAQYWFKNTNIKYKKPTDMFKDGYTTRNDEVVKIVKDTLDPNLSIETLNVLTDLLTKLTK